MRPATTAAFDVAEAKAMTQAIEAVLYVDTKEDDAGSIARGRGYR